jgi:hypothetical protein
VRVTELQAFDLVCATSPSSPGSDVLLVVIHGIDGSGVGSNEDGEDLSFPVAMEEVSPGVYSTLVVLQAGVYWTRFSVDGVDLDPTVIRVEPDGFTTEDAEVGIPYTVALTAPDSPSSVQLTVTDRNGALAGLSDSGEAVSWPEEMAQVPGYADAWYWESVTFSEGGRYGLSFAPSDGPIRNDVASVHEPAGSVGFAHSQGWTPDAALVPSSWVSLSYIRRWTGWSAAMVNDEDLRDLRRLAIDTWISETNCWVPSWIGTWSGMRAQGSRLYLPMPVVLPVNGGSDLEVRYVSREGSQQLQQEVNLEWLAWRVNSRDAKQPYVEMVGGVWDRDCDVKVSATWGMVGPRTQTPDRVKQAIVGLIRWHSLSLGVDGDDARDQATMHRINYEGTRDSRQDYHESAIGMGITGDPTIDRVLAQYRIDVPPWAHKVCP